MLSLNSKLPPPWQQQRRPRRQRDPPQAPLKQKRISPAGSAHKSEPSAKSDPEPDADTVHAHAKSHFDKPQPSRHAHGSHPKPVESMATPKIASAACETRPHRPTYQGPAPPPKRRPRRENHRHVPPVVESTPQPADSAEDPHAAKTRSKPKTKLKGVKRLLPMDDETLNQKKADQDPSHIQRIPRRQTHAPEPADHRRPRHSAGKIQSDNEDGKDGAKNGRKTADRLEETP